MLEHAELCVVGSWNAHVLAALAARDDRLMVDLAWLPDAAGRRGSPNYADVTW